MESDTYIVKVAMKPGFEEEIKSIAKLQAAKDKPRKLISAMYIIDSIVLVFELV